MAQTEYSIGKLVAQYPLPGKMMCIYQFDFGLIGVEGSVLGCQKIAPSASVQHGYRLNDNLELEMKEFAGPPVRFTISDRALEMIAIIKADQRLYEPEDPPEVLGVSWGTHYDNDGGKVGEGVFLAFYTRSQTAGFRGDFYRVSGIPIVMGGDEGDAARFDGKMLDYDESRWFFLRPQWPQ